MHTECFPGLFFFSLLYFSEFDYEYILLWESFFVMHIKCNSIGFALATLEWEWIAHDKSHSPTCHLFIFSSEMETHILSPWDCHRNTHRHQPMLSWDRRRKLSFSSYVWHISSLWQFRVPWIQTVRLIMVLPNANWSTVGGMGHRDLLSSHRWSTERKQRWLICFLTCAEHSKASISGFASVRKTKTLKHKLCMN